MVAPLGVYWERSHLELSTVDGITGRIMGLKRLTNATA